MSIKLTHRSYRRRAVAVRFLSLSLVLGAMLACGAASAQAAGSGVGITTFACNKIVFTYEGFANAEHNSVAEVVTVNHEIVATKTFFFNGPTGTDVVPFVEVPGKDLIDAHATWKTNGVNGGFDHHKKLKCQTAFAVKKLQKIAGGEGEFTTAQLTGHVGQTLDYEIVVTNTGTVPLKFSNFTDVHCDEGTVAGGSGEAFVAPEESTVFTCERALTGVGTFTNEATVDGTPEVGPTTNEPSNPVVTVVPPEAAFTIHKLQRVNGNGEFTTAVLEAGTGDEVEYEIVVTNTGNVPEAFSEFSDPKCDAGTIAGGPAGSLLPGESAVYTCDHVMLTKDTRKGPYKNSASVKATPPPGDGNPLTETSNTVEVTIVGGSGTTEFGCKAVTFVFTGFPNAENNSVNEVITAKSGGGPRMTLSTTVFTFNGPNGTNTVPIELGPGKWIVDAHVTWKTNGASGGFDQYAKVICSKKG